MKINDSNTEAETNISNAQAEIISVGSAPISSVEATSEVERIASQIEMSAKEQLDKLGDIEKAIVGLSPAVELKRTTAAFESVDNSKKNKNSIVAVENNQQAKEAVKKAVSAETVLSSPRKTRSKADNKQIVVSGIDTPKSKINSSKEKVVNNNTSTSERIVTTEAIKNTKALTSTAKSLDGLYKDERDRWRNQDGSYASKEAIAQQKESNKSEDDDKKGLLGRLVEVAAGNNVAEDGKGALGRIALGSFYDMGVEAMDIASDAKGYAQRAGETFKKGSSDTDDKASTPTEKAVVDKVKSDDVIKGKVEEKDDIKGELDEQTSLLKEIADKDFGGGASSSILDDLTDFSGSSKGKGRKKGKRGRIGRAFDKLKSKSPKLAKVSGFLGTGVDKVKGLFGRGAASGAAQSAGAGSKALNFAGKALSKLAVPLVVATAGFTKHQELKEREDLSDNQKNTVTASTAVGAGGGALAGAAAGAAVGSLVPFVGTLIGGLIGGALGAWAGSEGGSMAGEAVASMMESPVQSVESVKKKTNAEIELNNPFGGATEKSKSKATSTVASTSVDFSPVNGKAQGVNGLPLQSSEDNKLKALSGALAPAVNDFNPEYVESINTTSKSKSTTNNNAKESTVVSKHDPALIDEMKKVNNHLAKASQQASKKDNRTSAIPYTIPKSFDDTYLKSLTMDLR